MSNNDNTQQQNQPTSKITPDIFVTPKLSSETRSGQSNAIHIKVVNESLSMREINFSKSESDHSNK